MSVLPHIDTGAAASAPPRARDGRYVFAAGPAALEVEPAVGGRITALRLDGRNLLTGPEIDPGNYGSTFWTSPQSDWGWPPVPEIDHAPYEAEVEGAVLVLRGPASARLSVAVEKRLWADEVRGAFRIEYRVSNVGPAAVRAAPWEISRVPPGGLTFFPTGAGTYPPSNLDVHDRGGATWFDYDARTIVEHQKVFADGREGWIAHLDGDALFVKTFAAVARAEHAPGEAQIEIYANPAHTYVEVEQQGAYATIAPGGTLRWPVSWLARKLPAATAGRDRDGLVALVRRLVAESG